MPMLDQPMAYVLQRGTIETSLYLERINDTLDVFGIKGTQTLGVPASANTGSIGDLDGLRAVVNVGIGRQTTFLYEGRLQDIQFGSGTLNREAHELAFRYNILQETAGRTALSLQPIYRTNRGSGLRRSFSKLDAFGLGSINFRTPVSLEFGGAGDRTLAARLLASKRTSSRLLLHSWFEWGATEVTGELRTDIPIQQIQSLLTGLTYSQHHRVLGLGASWKLRERLFASLDMQRNWLDRTIDRDISNGLEENTVFHGRVSSGAGDKAWVTLDAQYFDHQLVGEVPFLYNHFTASRADKSYGYLGLGVTIPLEFGT